MSKQIGSQYRETLAESGYTLVRCGPGYIILRDMATVGYEATKDGFWCANNHHAGYTVQIGRWGYEYCRDIPRRTA